MSLLDLFHARPAPAETDQQARRKLVCLLLLPLAVLLEVGCYTMRSGQYRLHIGDLSLYYRVSSLVLHGRLPYRDFPLEYPPLSLLPFVLPRLLAFGHPLTFLGYLWLLLAENAVLATLIAVVLVRLTPWFLNGQEETLRRTGHLSLYALLVVIGSPLLPWRYDLFPALLTLVALSCVLRGRPTGAGILLGLGIAAKLYPVVLIPLFLLYYAVQRQRSEGVRLLLGSLGGVCLGVLPFVVVGLPKLLSFLQYHRHRGLEIGSLPAGVVLLARECGLTTASVVFNFGAFHIASPWSSHIIPWLPVAFVLAFSLVFLYAFRCFKSDFASEGRVAPDTLVAFLVAALLAFIVTNKVFSPQYLVWILPFAPLLRVREGMTFAILFALTIAVFPFAFPYLVTLAPAAILLVNVRNALAVLALIGIVAGQCVSLSPQRPTLPIMNGKKALGEQP